MWWTSLVGNYSSLRTAMPGLKSQGCGKHRAAERAYAEALGLLSALVVGFQVGNPVMGGVGQ